MSQLRLLVSMTLLASMLVTVSAARADDWPQWRGTERTGVSGETGLLQQWPAAGPKLLWKATGLGIGYASPAVVGERAYLLGTKGDDEYVVAVDVKSGNKLWAQKIGLIGENRGPNYPGPRSTPTVDKDLLYALGSDGDLACLRTDTGKLVWTKNLEKEFEGNRGTWAYCESVLLDGDRLICTPGGPQATLLALDKKTGAVIWKTPITNGGNQAGYASMIKIEAGGKYRYVQFLGSGVVAVDAADGKFLWRYTGNVGGVSANTVLFHGGCILASSSGLDGSGGDALLKLDEGKPGFKEVYNLRTIVAFHGGLVRSGDLVFGTGKVGLVCMDFKTGKKKWADRSIGSAALIAADGHLYLRASSGEVALVQIDADKYIEKGRFKQPERSKYNAFAHPVVANGRLYLRDADKLFCFDVKQK